MVQIIKTVAKWKKERPTQNELGFVPTMGALHKGHLSLIRRARADNAYVVVSIFVNPTQFNDPADLGGYPQTFEEDLGKLENLGVDFLFFPDYKELYPDNYAYKIAETSLSKRLCGATRPGHFEGVLTIVMKLLNIIRPDRAYFGEKDWQQYRLVRKMVQAFFMDVSIIACPLVREADGLAMSSRNTRLGPARRGIAPLFYKHLSSGRKIDEIKTALRGEGFQVEYIEKMDGRLLGAVRLGDVRLIDNVKI